MKIPFETGRWSYINKENTYRMCAKCSEDLIGDEFQFLFLYSKSEISNLRARYIYRTIYHLRYSNVKHDWYACLFVILIC